MALGKLDQVQRDRLDVIALGRLLAVLNDVLDLSQIEAGKLSLFGDDFDVADVARARRDLRDRPSPRAWCSASKSARPWRLVAALDRLRQISATSCQRRQVHAAGLGQRPRRVAPSGALRMVVTDTGVGIAPEAAQPVRSSPGRQFRHPPFRRPELSLAICRELTQMMGGSIDVESRGAMARRHRRTALPWSRSRPSWPAGPPTTATCASWRRDNANQQVLAAVLGSLGIDVHIVPDSKEAVEAGRPAPTTWC